MTPLNKLGYGIMSVLLLAFIIMTMSDTPMDAITGMVIVYFSGLGLSIQRKTASKHLTKKDDSDPKPAKVIYIEPIVSSPQPKSFNLDETIHFKTRKTANTSYFYLWDYYPKKKYPKLEDDLYWQRNDIWSFKDGLNPRSMVRKKSSALIINHFSKQLLHEYYLAIIPAPTAYSTNQSFRSLVSSLVPNTGMQDGFDMLKNSAKGLSISCTCTT